MNKIDPKALQDLLSHDKLEEVLDTLKAPCEADLDLKADWQALSKRLNRWASEKTREVKTENELEVDRNRIHEDLQGLVERCASQKSAGSSLVGFLQRFRVPLMLLFITLTCIGFLAMPVRSTHFEADIKTSDLNCRYEDNWPHDFSMSASRLYLGPLRDLRSIGQWEHHADKIGQPIEGYIDTGSFELYNLHLGASLHLRSRGPDLIMGLPAGATGDLSIQAGSLRIEPGLGSHTYNPNNADAVTFTAEPGMEIHLRTAEEKDWALPRLGLELIEFIRKTEGDQVQSAILGGEIRVPGRAPRALQVNDFVELGQLQAADFIVTPGVDTLLLKIQGETKLLKAGFGKLRSLKPSYLEYFYHDQRWALLFGAFVWLMGMLWTVRGALKGGKVAETRCKREEDRFRSETVNQRDGRYTVFGRVTKGMEVVEKISEVRTYGEDMPEQKISFSVELE
jgi:hypothetical protein